MEVIRMEYVAQFDTINGWLKDRNEPEMLLSEIPELGFMVMYKDKPIAAAFIRKVEGNFALYDGLVTDPEADAKLRNEANDVLTEYLLNEAKTLGFKSIIAFSKDKNTILRAQRHGFTIMPHSLIAKSLI